MLCGAPEPDADGGGLYVNGGSNSPAMYSPYVGTGSMTNTSVVIVNVTAMKNSACMMSLIDERSLKAPVIAVRYWSAGVQSFNFACMLSESLYLLDLGPPPCVA
jgi:hypothetical protein